MGNQIGGIMFGVLVGHMFRILRWTIGAFVLLGIPVYFTSENATPYWGVVWNIWYASMFLGFFSNLLLKIDLLKHVVVKTDLDKITDELAELKASINEIRR